MFNNCVLDYDESININYSPSSSIYLDACFLLINYNDGQEEAKERVANIIEKWHSEGVKILNISNHVSTEVINVLFILNIRKVIELVYLKNSGQIKAFEQEHLDELVNVNVARSLYNYGLNSEFRKGIESRKIPVEKIRFKVSDVIKDAKRILTPINRKQFDIYYQKAVTEFETLILALKMKGFNVISHSSRVGDMDKSSQYMVRFLLESYDAIHLSIAKQNDCDYFSTLDGDFNDVQFNDDDGKPIKILKIRSENGQAAFGF